MSTINDGNGDLKKEHAGSIPSPDNDPSVKKPNEGQKQERMAALKIDGKEYKVVDQVTVMEITSIKLVGPSGEKKEISQVIAHEFMMAEHKQYMVRLLTDAIMTVMRARRRTSMIKNCSEALFNKLKRRNSLKSFLRRK